MNTLTDILTAVIDIMGIRCTVHIHWDSFTAHHYSSWNKKKNWTYFKMNTTDLFFWNYEHIALLLRWMKNVVVWNLEVFLCTPQGFTFLLKHTNLSQNKLLPCILLL
jgi:hypothetical protein